MASMHIVAVICVALFTVKSLKVMPVPKLTAWAPLKLAPVIVTVSVCPRLPLAGLTAVTVGSGQGPGGIEPKPST